ncbi:MAG: diadenylate cyclase CdaA [Clostridia bacterium]|nr:diadenylate cyclase CdaA [Clostridia bacterium]
MDFSLQTLQNAFWNLRNRAGLADIIDIIIVAIIIYQLLRLVRHTRGSAVLKGFGLLLVATLISNIVGLVGLNWILGQIVSNGALVLVILFQPELRQALEQVGRGALLGSAMRSDEAEEIQSAIDGIVECCVHLSRRRVGALIVIGQKTGLKEYIETGTKVDAVTSSPLLENIFEPNTPLHDGAVIIEGTRVVAAACILTLTENRNIRRELGTRHRAGIGVTETTDALSIIVSEETGVISIAREGEISRGLDEQDLRNILDGLYQKPQRRLFGLIPVGKEGTKA